jgi:RNA polymerase sigma-70 factor (ECF subfamily)
MNEKSQCTVTDSESVIRTYADMVYKLAFAQVHNRTDADDVFQEVFLRYVRKNPPFESEEHRKAWLLRVTVNCAKRHHAAAWRKRTVPLEAELAAFLPEDHGLAESLDKLPEKYRAVIHLFYYEGYPTDQIGEILKIKPSAVRTRLTRARRMLGGLLEGET